MGRQKFIVVGNLVASSNQQKSLEFRNKILEVRKFCDTKQTKVVELRQNC